MRLKIIVYVAFLGLVASGVAFGSDSRPRAKAQENVMLDSSMILPATVDWNQVGQPGNYRACYTMRTYRVRTDFDRDSVIPVKPEEANFDPDSIIVGYSTCQQAEKFGVKSTK
jgi:hypothetical protein